MLVAADAAAGWEEDVSRYEWDLFKTLNKE